MRGGGSDGPAAVRDTYSQRKRGCTCTNEGVPAHPSGPYGRHGDESETLNQGRCSWALIDPWSEVSAMVVRRGLGALGGPAAISRPSRSRI